MPPLLLLQFELREDAEQILEKYMDVRVVYETLNSFYDQIYIKDIFNKTNENVSFAVYRHYNKELQYGIVLSFVFGLTFFNSF